MPTNAIYAGELGRDFALVVHHENDSYNVAAYDGDGNFLFDVAATSERDFVTAMLPTWSAQAVTRQQRWWQGRTDLQTTWPHQDEHVDDKPGPIADGRMLDWLNTEI